MHRISKVKSGQPLKQIGLKKMFCLRLFPNIHFGL